MIAFLSGKPKIIKDKLIVMVNGVGYGVTVGARTFASSISQSEAHLFIHTHVREEALELFGFDSQEDKELFELLLSVSGVGPKTAVQIVDLGAERIIKAVQTADVSLFASVPRVGKKLAQKIIIELKSKLGSLQDLNLGPRNQAEQDVVDALMALGFSDTDINHVLTELDISEEVEVAVLVRQAIKMMGTKK
jgi:holliday junction DNA helicase RuvA